MTVEIYALSVLRHGPVHGYELKRRIRRPSIAPVNNNALYPALRRLEGAGAVTRSVEQVEGRPARNVFAITDSGRALLLDLVSTLPRELAADDEEFLLRVSFFDELAVPARLDVLGARRTVVEEALGQVRGLLAEPPADAARRWRRRAQEQLVDRLEQELRWLDELRVAAERP
ncbi:helix-turn-helix transcriptional regulator [Cellulomonas hominis]|uniref:Helix-turn-helix transcriptional regulator n=1 Tax=Cellulomonas hominis TaxID=156981 RepID=A0A7Z8JZ48_9CELL|nr:PadR family transcriptional regulator [Cellulomonas hominis]TKR23384.1 helix-turn-helix transcriptional regulator [Cellulomonas hominis]